MSATPAAQLETLPGLYPNHLLELRASGLSDETITKNGIRSESTHTKLRAILNWPGMPKRMGSALLIPYTGPDGVNGYYRAKFDNPRKERGKDKRIKYEAPMERGNEPYFPAGVIEAINDPSSAIYIAEGEKKALKLTQEGFPTIGISGVYSWKDGTAEKLLAKMAAAVDWKGRKVYILFDSDIDENEAVQSAESRLAYVLKNQHGANVRCVRLPSGPDGQKVGADDFLVANPPSALHKLVAEAIDPCEVPAVEHRVNAKALDPADEGKKYLSGGLLDGVYRLRFWRGQFWLWRHGAYRSLQNAEVRSYLIEYLNGRCRQLTSNITGNIIDQVRAQSLLSGSTEAPAWSTTPPNDWQPDEILAAKNGLLHLPSLVAGQDCLLPPTPRFLTTSALAYEARLDAPRPDGWLTFLDQLWPDDPQSIEALQCWFGYLLTSDTSQQKIFLLIGPKRSGKGTIIRVLQSLIGKENIASPNLASLGGDFGLQPLLGKTLAVVSDARLSGRTDSAIVVERLLSISGEDAQTVNRKHMEQVTCKLSARWMIVSNELPRLGDSSGALTGRMILATLTRSFYQHEDTKLTSKLLTELPGILLWAIEGWQRLRERGHFLQPDAALEMLGELSDLSSPMAQFVRERCLVGPQYQATVSQLYVSWSGWCTSVGRNEPGTMQTFGRDLSAAVPSIRRRRLRDESAVRFRVYDGIGLND